MHRVPGRVDHLASGLKMEKGIGPDSGRIDLDSGRINLDRVPINLDSEWINLDSGRIDLDNFAPLWVIILLPAVLVIPHHFGFEDGAAVSDDIGVEDALGTLSVCTVAVAIRFPPVVT